MDKKLADLKELGPKSAKHLHETGIFTRSNLAAVGPVQAFIKLTKKRSVKPGMNYLYAMVGALENKNWSSIAKKEKGRSLIELEDYRELETMINADNKNAEAKNEGG